MTPDDLLDGLDPEQREVARALRGPVCVIAGAGTGKTRAITHRIAFGVACGVYKPQGVLAVTFTTRAAGEMKSRLAALGSPGVQARTFHSAALRQARYFWPQVYGGGFPQIVQSKFALVSDTVRRLGMRADNALVRDLAAEIEWAKVTNTTPDAYPKAGREVADLAPAEVAAVLRGYEDLKRERERIDMEDILLVTAAMLADHDEIAAQVRRAYQWFVVDEFQDVNPLQATLLDLWLGGRDEICVVGDPRQTIYSFAGASPDVLRDFTRRHAGAQRLELVRNYRSTPQVLDVANTVIGDMRGVRLVSQREPGPPVSYVGHADEPAEAQAVAQEITALHAAGMPYRDMAVLFRINAQSEAFEEALGAALIPFTLRGVEGFFHRTEVRQAVTLLRGAARAGEGSDGGLVGDVRAVLASMGYTDDPPAGAGQVRDRWESMHAVVSMAAELPAGAGLPELVADLDRRAEHAHAPVADGVTLATLHAAKGLEWDAVFCVGMHEGMMPSVHAETPAAVDEERRLFYVGLTRAKRHLRVSWAASRNPGGRGNRRPTRFLDGLVDIEPARRPRRRKLPVPTGDFDAALFERLREWRAKESSQQSVPAFVVFNDATLQAIAATLPGDEQALLALPGIGPSKIEKYGSAVLQIVGEAGQ